MEIEQCSVQEKSFNGDAPSGAVRCGAGRKERSADDCGYSGLELEQLFNVRPPGVAQGMHVHPHRAQGYSMRRKGRSVEDGRLQRR